MPRPGIMPKFRFPEIPFSSFTPEYHKERRRILAARAICPACMEPNPDNSRQICPECAEIKKLKRIHANESRAAH